MSVFFLTQLEEKVFFGLSDGYVSVTLLSLTIQEPRTSVFKALQNLEKHGPVISKKVRLKNQHVYTRVSDDALSLVFDSIKKKIFKKQTSLFSVEGKQFVHCFSGEDAIFERLCEMMKQEKGARIYTVQPSGMTKNWVSFLGEEKVLKIHTLFKEHGLIVVGLQGEGYSHYMKEYKEEIFESFKNRLDMIHVLPEKFLEKDTALYVYGSSVLFFDLQQSMLLDITSQTFAKILKKNIDYILETAPRVREIYKKPLD